MLAGRYAEYFNDPETSDVEVFIQTTPREPTSQREHTEGGFPPEEGSVQLSAHSVILKGNSPVFKAELERWQDNDQPKRVTILIDKGEEAIACKLVQCLYTDSTPDVDTPDNLRDVLGLLMLADKYQVEAAVAMCTARLAGVISLSAITWEIAEQVMQLPAMQLEKAGIQHLLMWIQVKVLRHVDMNTKERAGVGLDLEFVFNVPKLLQGFLSLPTSAVIRLLGDDRCGVASENTILAAIWRKLEHDDDKVDDESERSLSERRILLSEILRVPHLTVLFAAAVPSFARGLGDVLGHHIYALGREFYALSPELRASLLGHCRRGKKLVPECWSRGPHARSTVTELNITWRIPAAEVAISFNEEYKSLASSRERFFSGIHWVVLLKSKQAIAEGAAAALSLQLTGYYPDGATGHLLGAAVSVKVLGAGNGSCAERSAVMTLLSGTGRGWDDMFGPPMVKWDPQQMQRWVNDEGNITITVTISKAL